MATVHFLILFVVVVVVVVVVVIVLKRLITLPVNVFEMKTLRLCHSLLALFLVAMGESL